VDHSSLCGRDYRGRGPTGGPGGLRLRGSWVKISRSRQHSPKRAPRDSEVPDGYISKSGSPATGHRRGHPTKPYLLSPEKLYKISRGSRVFRRLCIQNRRRCPLPSLQRFCGLENSTNLAVTDARLHLRAPFICAGAAHRCRRVVLCHQSLRDLEWHGNHSENRYVGRAIWDSTPTVDLVTDAPMEGWGTEMHTSRHDAGTQQPVALSVPGRCLFTPDDAEPRSINQRELLAAILGLQRFLLVTRDSHVQHISDAQVMLAVTRNSTSRSPRMMVLLRILRMHCEEKVISLGLQYIPSVFNIWADCLSRRRDASDWMVTPAVVAEIRRFIQNTVLSQDARRENAIPGVCMVIENGAHPRRPDARPSWFGTPPPRPGSVRGRCCHSRFACPSLVSPCTPRRRSYGPPRGSHLAPSPSHGNSPLLRAVRVDGKTPRLPLQAPAVF
jgi:hypothetical protein